jgi:hypothetical protein
MTDDPRLGAYIVAPALVVSAFASELYIKCLLCLHGLPVPPTHNLKNLFSRLPGKIQKTLEKKWDAYVPTRAEMFEHARTHLNYTGATNLRSAIADGATAFDEIRYAYEGTPSSKFFLADLPSLLRSLILELKPEWHNLGPGVGPVPTFQIGQTG